MFSPHPEYMLRRFWVFGGGYGVLTAAVTFAKELADCRKEYGQCEPSAERAARDVVNSGLSACACGFEAYAFVGILCGVSPLLLPGGYLFLRKTSGWELPRRLILDAEDEQYSDATFDKIARDCPFAS